MAATLKRAGTDMAPLSGSASAPALGAPPQDWSAGWDSHPMLAASPRYTIGAGGMAKNGGKIPPQHEKWKPSLWMKPEAQTGPHRRLPQKSRDTFLDQHTRRVAWVPGPGTHRKVRDFDTLPAEEDEADDMWSLGKLRDRTTSSRFSKDKRSASGPIQVQPQVVQIDGKWQHSLKNSKPTLYPSSYLSPGPGMYCSYTSFGAASGATRKRYFAVSKHDNQGQARVAEKFGRHSDPEQFCDVNRTRWS